jgi:hypothetical protein
VSEEEVKGGEGGKMRLVVLELGVGMESMAKKWQEMGGDSV